MGSVHVSKVIETTSVDEVNKLLKEGWVVLSSGFIQSPDGKPPYHSYSLGYPSINSLFDEFSDE